MQKQNPIGLAVIITAIVVGGAVYYFTGKKTPESANADKGNSTFTTFNQSSSEYAVMGRELWSAFACSSWASKTGDAKEQERLFLLGYEQGKKFLGALRAEKITQEDIEDEVPIGVTMLLQGPSDEFILGRIFENAQEEALGEVYKTGDEFNSDEIQKLIAGNKFLHGNCRLVGN